MKRSRVGAKNSGINIPCGWEGCNAYYRNDLLLNNHIREHLDRLQQSDVNQHYCCLWDDCEFSTKDKMEIDRHVYYHGYYNGLLMHGRKDFASNPELPKCCVDMKDYKKLPELKSNFNCEWLNCDCSFASIVEFQEHIEQHAEFEYEIGKTPEIKRPKTSCKWSFCNRVMDSKYRLIEHIHTHSQRKKTACYHCGEVFRSRTALFDHLRRQPDNNTHKYQCTYCFKYFATEKLLRSHVSKHLNCYKCSLCDMTCPSASGLATHVRYRHLKDKPINCTKCSYRCVRKSDLEKHMHYMHMDKVHRCEHVGCDYAVRSYNFLQRHYLEVHERTPIIYVCHCCDKPFKSGKSLSIHLIKKHDFQLPSGHKRFTYKIDENGFYRLETMRIESLEVTQQILSPNPFKVAEVAEDSSCYEIVSLTNEQDERKLVASDSTDIKYAGEVVISLPSLDD